MYDALSIKIMHEIMATEHAAIVNILNSLYPNYYYICY